MRDGQRLRGPGSRRPLPAAVSLRKVPARGREEGRAGPSSPHAAT